MNEPRTLQQWIKQLRAAQDLTQEALAEHVGCAPQTIRLIERGARRPSRAMAERLADVLHVAPAERPAFLRVARPPRIPAAPEAAPHGAPVPSHAHPLPAASLPVPSVPLLVTKILPPPARRHVLPRPRLTAQLGTFHDSLVTLIAAPAGWGKTTLLTAWIGSLPPAETRRVAWVALDEADNDPVRLLRYIIAALQRVAPELGVTAVALLDAPQPALDAVLAVLINDLAALEQPVALVLDDYHLVRAPAMH
jgi:LuxR family maltose regulon positive regulatory protein